MPNTNPNTPMKLFIAGDSTAASYPPEKAPMAGWGQRIGALFQDNVAVHNQARNGRSSKSFIEEGHLKAIEQAIGPGDYLFIQFGHNDQKPDAKRHTEPDSTYPEYLSRYIQFARSQGAQPVLLTSVERRQFNEAGELVPSHGVYPEAVRRLARQQDVPLLDLTSATQSLYERLGPEAAKALFTWLEPGKHPNYPDGVQDDTHFNENGALQIARLVAGQIRLSGLPLAKYLKAD